FLSGGDVGFVKIVYGIGHCPRNTRKFLLPCVPGQSYRTLTQSKHPLDIAPLWSTCHETGRHRPAGFAWHWELGSARASAGTRPLHARRGKQSVDAREDHTRAKVVLRPATLARWHALVRKLPRAGARVRRWPRARSGHQWSGGNAKRAGTDQSRLRPIVFL